MTSSYDRCKTDSIDWTVEQCLCIEPLDKLYVVARYTALSEYLSQSSEPLVVLDSYNGFSAYRIVEGIDVLYSISIPQS